MYKTYPLEKVSLFADEGVYYYVYYFQCLQVLFKKHKGRVTHDEIKAQAMERCYNAKLMLNRYSTDKYLAGIVQLILSEIEAVESLFVENEDSTWE